MIQQQSTTTPAAAPPAPAELARIHAWIGEWSAVRQLTERLISAPEHAAPDHDGGQFLTLLDEIDSSSRLLHHRVGRLSEQLGQTSDS